MNNDQIAKMLIPLIEKTIQKQMKKLVQEEVQKVLMGSLSQIITECFKASGNIQNAEQTYKLPRKSVDQAKQMLGKFAPTDVLEEELEEMEEENKRMLEIHRPKQTSKVQKLQEVSGFNGAFDDVEPISQAGREDDGEIGKKSSIFEMRNIDPEDPGIKLDAIYKAIGGKRTWDIINNKMGQHLKDKRNQIVAEHQEKQKRKN